MVKGVNCEYLKQIEDARKDLHNLLSSNKQMAPIVLRLAFHDAATYDRKTQTGGANGSIRNELNNPPNKGIDTAVKFLEPVKKKHPMLTYADLYQLAGIVAVKVTGGPIIEFVPGRADASNQSDKGSIPNPRGDAAHLRSIFVDQMGLTDKDIVVLSGAHALGRAHQDRSGFDGPFTRDPLTFDNSYYTELLKGDTKGLVKFPTDKVLLSDNVFRPLVQLYARDKGAFFRDYAMSHKKLSELGFNPNMIHAQAHRNNPHHQAQAHHHYAQCC
uniref:L-ascorbate peroxidase n=1 Tax=Opuntia streptacantha TaxID=393608 RepID=A0A7C9D6K9_OPUST